MLSAVDDAADVIGRPASSIGTRSVRHVAPRRVAQSVVNITERIDKLTRKGNATIQRYRQHGQAVTWTCTDCRSDAICKIASDMGGKSIARVSSRSDSRFAALSRTARNPHSRERWKEREREKGKGEQRSSIVSPRHLQVISVIALDQSEQCE